VSKKVLSTRAFKELKFIEQIKSSTFFLS